MTAFSTSRPSKPITLASDPVAHALEETLFGRCLGDEPGPPLVSRDFERAYRLADRVLALREPWRSRFVDYMAFRVCAGSGAGQCPSRSQVAVWLTDERLHRLIWELLRTWLGEV
jgi:hypothetical protein